MTYREPEDPFFLNGPVFHEPDLDMEIEEYRSEGLPPRPHVSEATQRVTKQIANRFGAACHDILERENVNVQVGFTAFVNTFLWGLRLSVSKILIDNGDVDLVYKSLDAARIAAIQTIDEMRANVEARYGDTALEEMWTEMQGRGGFIVNRATPKPSDQDEFQMPSSDAVFRPLNAYADALGLHSKRLLPLVLDLGLNVIEIVRTTGSPAYVDGTDGNRIAFFGLPQLKTLFAMSRPH